MSAISHTLFLRVCNVRIARTFEVSFDRLIDFILTFFLALGNAPKLSLSQNRKAREAGPIRSETPHKPPDEGMSSRRETRGWSRTEGVERTARI